MYQRKTRDVYQLLADYGTDGWEYVLEEYTWAEAKKALVEYKTNAPGYQYKIKKVRERIGE